jgi:hypothetical protein
MNPLTRTAPTESSPLPTLTFPFIEFLTFLTFQAFELSKSPHFPHLRFRLQFQPCPNAA